MNRLTDHDRHFGPITYGPSGRKVLSLRFCTGGGEDEDGYRNHLWIQFPGWVATLKLPNLVKPWTEVRTYQLKGHEGETYTIDYEREWGVDLSWSEHTYLSILYGPQTMDSRTTKRKGFFLGWGNWRHVRRSYYTPEHDHFFTEPKGPFMRNWDECQRQKEACPKVYFQIEDYDGKKITATCMVEEMEWRFGDKWFKWLSWFKKPMIRRSIDIAFDYELGSEKGSWKGGTLGHGIEMLPGEYPINAFKRYCEKGHKGKIRTTPIKFIGPCGPPEPHNIIVARNRGWIQEGSMWRFKTGLGHPSSLYTTDEMLACIKKETDAHNAQVGVSIKAS